MQSEIESVQSKYEAKLGDVFILEKDTLTIVDYSFIKSTFTLSDGSTVASSLIFKNDNTELQQ